MILTMLKTNKLNDKLIISESYITEVLIFLSILIIEIIRTIVAREIYTFIDLIKNIAILVPILILTVLRIGYSKKIIVDKSNKIVTIKNKKLFKNSKLEIQLIDIKEILLVRRVVERSTARNGRYVYKKDLYLVDNKGEIINLLNITNFFLNYLLHKDTIGDFAILMSEYINIPLRVEDTN